jgi:hypothetical protein
MTHLHSKFCYPICKATGGRDNPSKVAAMVKSFMEEPPEMEEIMRAEFDIVGSIKPWANARRFSIPDGERMIQKLSVIIADFLFKRYLARSLANITP